MVFYSAMHIETDEQINHLVEVGLDEYESDTDVPHQVGGQITKDDQQQLKNILQQYPVIVMNANVLRVLNFFKDIENIGELSKQINQNYLFSIYITPEEIEQKHSEYNLRMIIKNNDEYDFDNPVEIGIIKLKIINNEQLELTIYDLIEKLFQYVQSGTTDALLEILTINRMDDMDLNKYFIDKNALQDNTQIMDMSESLSKIKREFDIDELELTQNEKGNENWITNGIRQKIDKSSNDTAKKELDNAEWKIYSNRGGGDCFFLSICQSGSPFEGTDKQNKNVLFNTNTNEDCVKNMRKFIASWITREQFNTYLESSYQANTQNLPENINTLTNFKKYVKSSSYYMDELGIQILYDHTNLFPIILYYRTKFDTKKTYMNCVLGKGKINRDTLQDKVYIFLKYIEDGGGHYELIGYRNKDNMEYEKYFTYETLPEFAKLLIEIECEKRFEKNHNYH